MKSKIKCAVAITTLVILQGCSGHPGAGHWQAGLNVVNSQYSALEIEFDGKGTLHPNTSLVGQESQQDLWCVWQARSAIALDIQCGDGSEEKTNIKFELTMVGEKQEGAFSYMQAQLSQAGKIVASFKRKG